MSKLAVIRSVLQKVVPFLGETWQYRTLTSGKDVTDRTYSDFADVTAHCSERTHVEVYDERHHQNIQEESGVLFVADTLVLSQGDQVKSPQGEVFAVMGISARANQAGTIAYRIRRVLPLVTKQNRGDGV